MKKKTKKAVAKIVTPPMVEPINSNYQARIKVLGHTYEATGLTAAEAITNLKPLKGRGVSVLTIIKDGKERSKILNSMLTMNLFSPSHMRREMGLKNAISIFADL